MNEVEAILKSIPKSPGIYQFFNKDGKIIYIGKSINLKTRVNSYFNGKSKLNFAKKKMVSEVQNIETIIVNNEKESLIFESTLIKKHKPKYNILMKDDKNYLYIKISDELIPKIFKTRIKTNSGIYFGPYISSSHVNNILKIIKKIFGFRSCNIVFENKTDNTKLKNIKIKSSNGIKIPCIDYYTKRCSGPCLLGEKEINEYTIAIEEIKNFLNGDFKKIILYLQSKMLAKASELKFEEANTIKHDIESIKSLEEQQIVRDYVKGDFDVINYIEKYEKIYIGYAIIRDSKLIDFKNYEIEIHLEETIGEVLEYFIEREVELNSNSTLLSATNIDLKIKYEVPRIGPKLDLLKFVYKNIYEYAYKKHLNNISTKGFSKQTMKNLLSILGYKELNSDLIFECNDISHLSGSHTVASRSIIENGKPNKNKYRKFNIKELEELKIDDFSSMREVMKRRLKELIEKGNIPDLIIIDGGKGQLNSVLQIIENEKQQNNYNLILDKLQLVSIAKKQEELFLPGKNKPIILDKDSQELRLVQKIRDESHRFAITFNKEKRLKSEKRNILESIPGIGPKTRSKLIKTYGNINNLKGIDREILKKTISISQIESLENHGII